MLTHDALDLVREPETGSPLVPDEAPGRLRSTATGLAFRVEGEAVVLSSPLAGRVSQLPVALQRWSARHPAPALKHSAVQRPSPPQ